MFGKTTAVALAALGLWATSAPAQDFGAKVYRLGDLNNVQQAQPQEDDDTQLVHYRRGFYGGYRPYYSSFYYPRASFSYSYYRPYYNYYRPVYNYYRPAYYYSQPYYYYPRVYSYYYPCNLNTTVFSTTIGSYPQTAPAQTQPLEPMRKADEFAVPPVPREEGIFPYDGGPVNPVPMPKADPVPQKGQPIDPALGRVASMPARTTTFTYPAYGEKVGPTGLVQQPPSYLKTESVKAALR